MRVLHVFGRLERGGAELRTLELIEELDRSSVESDFLVLDDSPGTLEARALALGSRILRCPLSAGFPIRLYRLLLHDRYDVVHSHVHYFSGLILAVAQMAGVPGRIIHLRTSADDHTERSLRRWLQRKIFRTLADVHATQVLAVSEGVMAEAWNRSWQSDPRCRVIYNGIRGPRVSGAHSARMLKGRIVNIASVQDRKNHLRLLSIFAACRQRRPDLELLIAGRRTGKYAEQVASRIESDGLKDSVSLAGEIDDVPSLLTTADLMIFPSKWEGLPGAVLEACVAGVPVLASELPGTREIARYFPYVRTLSLAEPDEVWAEAGCALIDDAPTCRTRAQAAFAASPFSLDEARRHCYQIWHQAAMGTHA